MKRDADAALLELRDKLLPAGRAAVHAYARRRCPNVPLDFVDALCQALGEISMDETLTALDREQAKHG